MGVRVLWVHAIMLCVYMLNEGALNMFHQFLKTALACHQLKKITRNSGIVHKVSPCVKQTHVYLLSLPGLSPGGWKRHVTRADSEKGDGKAGYIGSPGLLRKSTTDWTAVNSGPLVSYSSGG